jgi:glycosyltransferase involved in cell wall biosynthesis
MRITIGIPVYNTENYFGQCLNSVLAQRGADLEILVVDDCSTDKTVGIIDEAMKKDSRIKLIRHTERKGVLYSRQEILDQMSGDYLLFVDSDDYLLPNAIETIVKELNQATKENTIIVFNAEILHFHGSVSLWYPKKKKIYTTSEAVRAALESELYSFLWGALIPKACLQGIVLNDPSRGMEDLSNMFLIFAKSGEVRRIPEVCYAYRVRKGSITNSGDSFDHALVSYHLMLAYAQEHCPEAVPSLKWRIADVSTRKIAFQEYGIKPWKEIAKELKPYQKLYRRHLFAIWHSYHAIRKQKLGALLFVLSKKSYAKRYLKYKSERTQ